jgi:hypothetical protein
VALAVAAGGERRRWPWAEELEAGRRNGEAPADERPVAGMAGVVAARQWCSDMESGQREAAGVESGSALCCAARWWEMRRWWWWWKRTWSRVLPPFVAYRSETDESPGGTRHDETELKALRGGREERDAVCLASLTESVVPAPRHLALGCCQHR